MGNKTLVYKQKVIESNKHLENAFEKALYFSYKYGEF